MKINKHQCTHKYTHNYPGHESESTPLQNKLASFLPYKHDYIFYFVLIYPVPK